MDTCCVIDLLKGDLLLPPDVNDNEIWSYRKLLEASKRGDIGLFCSAFVYAECTHLKGEDKNKVLNDEVKEKINWLLDSGQSGVTMAAITPFTLEIARELLWEYDISLKPGDSVHVATAIELRAKELITSDDFGKENIQRLKDHYGLDVCEGSETKMIPIELRQNDAFESE